MGLYGRSFGRTTGKETTGIYSRSHMQGPIDIIVSKVLAAVNVACLLWDCFFLHIRTPTTPLHPQSLPAYGRWQMKCRPLPSS